VLERLIEAWTDKVSERSYQAPFCQMLVSQGHEIIHTTRHCALEFGKDVISRDPSGRLCAFQLKGHPGGRLTKSGFTEILPQLRELLTLRVSHPNVAAGTKHRAFLVTNGEIDEEAQRGLDDLKRDLGDGHAAFDFEVISRGRFLNWAKELAGDLWPTELGDWNLLLELLVTDGRSLLPIAKVDQLLRAVLLPPATGGGERTQPNAADSDSDSGPSDSQGMPAAQLRRRVASAAVLTAVALRNFNLAENHFAIATAWTLFASYVAAAAEREGTPRAQVSRFIDIAESAVFTSLVSLAEEACARSVPVEGSGLGEVIAYPLRLTLLCGLLGLLWFWLPSSDMALLSKIREFLHRHVRAGDLWGEGAVPQLLFGIWALRDSGDGDAADRLLESYTRALLLRSLGNGPPLYGPYWDVETIVKHQWATSLRLDDDPLRDEDPTGDSFFSEGLLQLMARQNLKWACKNLWPAFSKVSIRRFDPAPRWARHLWRAETGTDHTEISPPHRAWDNLVEEAYLVERSAPDALTGRPFLEGVIAIVMPHRCTTEKVRGLADNFDSSWRRGAGSRTKG
jgi:hypothetical protein